MTEQTFPPKSTENRRVRSRALMGTAIALVLGGALVGGAVLPSQTSALADPVQVQGVQPISFADVVEKVRPAVVSVRVKTTGREMVRGGEFEFELPFELPEGSPMERFFKQFREDRRLPQLRRPPTTGLGSGFFISEDGYVVTNNHVIDKNQSVTVITDDGGEYAAEVIGIDDKTDLALLKVDADRTFTYVKFSDDEIRVGDWVVAVGNPFGLGGTVTAGIISARGRQIGAGPYDDFIQIDAAVNRGNSGGPAFNFKGEVVGVNTAIFSPSGGNVGIAFAIPSDMAQRIIADLKDDGVVVRGWLGVQIQPVTRDIADSLRLDDASGALVAETQSGSPAEKAGIATGDTILAVNGKMVDGPRGLALMISQMAPGTKATLTYWRDGARHEVDVTLGQLPATERQASLEEPQPSEPSALADFGMAIAPAEGDGGVVITDVDPNGQAAERGLQRGDIILEVGNAAVADPAAVEKKLADAKASGLKAILLRIKSGEQTRFVALPLAQA
jgi:serine protease Do